MIFKSKLSDEKFFNRHSRDMFDYGYNQARQDIFNNKTAKISIDDFYNKNASLIFDKFIFGTGVTTENIKWLLDKFVDNLKKR